MKTKAVQLSIGFGLFLVGCAVLAYGEGEAWTGVGTTAGVAGLGLMVWAWLRGGSEAER